MPVIIKGMMLDDKRPMVCVPIIEKEKEHILEKARLIVENDISMIEWRCDYYEKVCDEDELRKIIKELADITKDVILLVTLRTKSQGGCADFNEKTNKSIIQTIASTRCADIIDVEYKSFENVEELVLSVQSQGAYVLLSHHDFDKTPILSEMEAILDEMTNLDPDIVKLAVMPHSKKDLIRVFEVTNDYKQKNPSMALITMAMGKIGLLSRLGGEVFGSCVTFASIYGKSSAPGQMPAEEVNTILDAIHRYGG